ncbi:MAG: TRAP transporter small permease [Boseongicola sp.]
MSAARRAAASANAAAFFVVNSIGQSRDRNMSLLLLWIRAFNALVGRLCMALAIAIVAIMVVALTASAVTRYVTGIGYDWLIELPPMLVPWLVFPLLGPLLKSNSHISVDVAEAYLSAVNKRRLRILLYLVVLLSAAAFMVAGYEAVELFRNLGQVVELEVEFPIWYLYAAFPVGFAILSLFALELLLAELLNMPDETAEKLETMA